MKTAKDSSKSLIRAVLIAICHGNHTFKPTEEKSDQRIISSIGQHF